MALHQRRNLKKLGMFSPFNTLNSPVSGAKFLPGSGSRSASVHDPPEN